MTEHNKNTTGPISKKQLLTEMQSEPLSLELKTTEETPHPDGYLRLVSLAEMKPRTTCVACHKPLKSEG